MHLLTPILIVLIHQSTAKLCSLDVARDIESRSPLLIKKQLANGIQSFYLPDANGKIIIAKDTILSIACVQAKLKLKNKKLDFSEIDITCVDKDKFQINKVEHKFNEIKCSSTPTRSVSDGGPCINGGIYKKIGYQLKNRFIDIINVCFNTKLQTPIYSISKINRFVSSVTCNSLKFLNDGQYTIPVKEYYEFEKQQQVINDQIGLSAADTKVITQKNEKFIIKGHLTAMADFTYPIHQQCTFFYVNAAPQFQIYNNGVWKSVEKYVRELAINQKKDLTVVTGVYGTLKLKDESNGQMEEIYLYKNGNNKALPVPEFFWKFVYDKQSKAGVVMVATNDPTEKMPTVCSNNVCSQLTWIKINKKHTNFIMCCEYNDFYTKFPNTIPFYTVNTLFV